MSAQNTPPTIVTGGVRSLTEQLKQHHVGLTEASLVEALRNADQQVRYLAALRLAEEKDQDAVPAMEEAVATEKVPETRINIGIALAQLGQERGVAELTTSCENSDLPGYLRARAATALLGLGKEACFRAAVDLLDSSTDSRIQALSLLPHYRQLSKVQSDEVLKAVCRSLTAEAPEVRVAAGAALAQLGEASAIPNLQNAIAVEKDDSARSQMQTSLDQLRKKAGR